MVGDGDMGVVEDVCEIINVVYFLLVLIFLCLVFFFEFLLKFELKFCLNKFLEVCFEILDLWVSIVVGILNIKVFVVIEFKWYWCFWWGMFDENVRNFVCLINVKVEIFNVWIYFFCIWF